MLAILMLLSGCSYFKGHWKMEGEMEGHARFHIERVKPPQPLSPSMKTTEE
jgi:hypothetical protein